MLEPDCKVYTLYSAISSFNNEWTRQHPVVVGPTIQFAHEHGSAPASDDANDDDK